MQVRLFPVLLIVFLRPEPPAPDLFRDEFFSFHIDKSSPGLVVEEMIFPVKDTMKLRDTGENPANILGSLYIYRLEYWKRYESGGLEHAVPGPRFAAD